jgi:acetoacetate decarboxylase
VPFTPSEGVRYDMPVAFGPSVSPGVETGFEFFAAGFRYLTDAIALAAFLPRWFDPFGEPVVTFSYRRMMNMAWMGGRNYNILTVGAPAIYRGSDEPVIGQYTLAIWENDCAPIIAGRELMGSPKRYAVIPDADITQVSFEVECREYDSRLVTAVARNMTAVTNDELAVLVQQGQSAVGLNWKYIPSTDGTADVDYPTALYMQLPYVAAWRGEGDVTLGEPTFEEAPYSSHIVRALACLPRLENRGVLATHAVGASLFRERTRRLDVDASSGKAAISVAAGQAQRI